MWAEREVSERAIGRCTMTAKMRTACDKCGNLEHIPLPPQARR